MPLVKCPMCEKDISPNAVSCPNCGEPMKNEKQEIDSYKIILTKNGKTRLDVISKIRTITGCNLPDAKKCTDLIPSTIISNIPHSQASKYKKILEGAGATIEIVPINSDKVTYYTLEIASKTVITCPNCKSPNVKKISGASKVGSAALFGVFAMGKITKTYECNNCQYRW